MGYIPEDARWYLADVVLEHIIADDPRNIIHINTHLVEANSPEQAYEKALALGRDSEGEYTNTDGKSVRVVFHGLRELNVIHEALEDGTELMYREMVGVSPEQLRGWSRPKEVLAVFAPMETKGGCPNYMPESVMQLLESAEFDREDVKKMAGGGDETDPRCQ